MDKYLLTIIVLVIFSIILILYVRISHRGGKDDKNKINYQAGDNFTLLE